MHATLQPALSVGRSVGWLVGWSVTLYFFYDFISLTSLLLPKWSGDLKYGPCPPARDFGSRVSGLVYFPKVKTGSALAQYHSTSITMSKKEKPYIAFFDAFDRLDSNKKKIIDHLKYI